MSDEVVEGETLGFQQLKDAGGFELLQCQSNCRKLSMITCPWTVKDLKANLGTQSKIYVRPIQHNLSTKPLKPENVVRGFCLQVQNFVLRLTCLAISSLPTFSTLLVSVNVACIMSVCVIVLGFAIR